MAAQSLRSFANAVAHGPRAGRALIPSEGVAARSTGRSLMSCSLMAGIPLDLTASSAVLFHPRKGAWRFSAAFPSTERECRRVSDIDRRVNVGMDRLPTQGPIIGQSPALGP